MGKQRGITLIALVITIIVLLILAGIAIETLLGENGIITRATKAKEEHKIAEAREKLSLVLIDAGIEKRINIKYNQDAFLDEFVKTNLEGSKIKGDIAIVDGYAFSLDRSVPKIGEYIGKEKDLVFPELSIDTRMTDNNDSATITITTKEDKKGIHKIEIIQDGFVIKEYTYENKKEKITETYTTDKNGTYIIKVYADLASTEMTEVKGIVSPIVYEPNGSEQYAKEHTTKVSVSEANEKIKSIKYQWLQTTAEPEASSFTESVANGGTITKNGITGKWYLWTLVETESGVTRTGKSEAFYFDNTGPSVTLTSTPTSVTAFTLLAEANDEAGIKQYDFYVNNKKYTTVTTSEGTATCNVTGAITGNTSCYVIVTDNLGNSTKKTVTAKTKLYAWEKWNTDITYKWKIEKKNLLVSNYRHSTSNSNPDYEAYCVEFDSSTGSITKPGVSVPSWAGWASEEVVYLKGKLEGYYICTVGAGGIGRYDTAYYDIYSIEKKQVEDTVNKGTSKLGMVTSANKDAFKSNQRNSDGYWYVSVSPR